MSPHLHQTFTTLSNHEARKSPSVGLDGSIESISHFAGLSLRIRWCNTEFGAVIRSDTLQCIYVEKNLLYIMCFTEKNIVFFIHVREVEGRF